ncbi:GMP synthase [Pseudomonadota bacterium]
MKLGILHCGSVLPAFQVKFSDYPDMIQHWLADTGQPIEFSIYAVNHGTYPKHINDCDAYITTGSHESVYEHKAWINQFQSYLSELHKNRKKLIGICFGHQLIAQALGGKTKSATYGWGVGVKTSNIVTQPNWMQPPLSKLNLLVSHQDQVTELPADSVLIAASDYCPHAAYTVGSHILCFQGHPEFNKQYSETLMRHRGNLLGKKVLNEGLASLTLPTDEKVVAQWIMTFINQN